MFGTERAYGLPAWIVCEVDLGGRVKGVSRFPYRRTERTTGNMWNSGGVEDDVLHEVHIAVSTVGVIDGEVDSKEPGCVRLGRDHAQSQGDQTPRHASHGCEKWKQVWYRKRRYI